MNADEPMDARDLELLASIAELFDEIDPPPAELDEDVLVALALAGFDAELATLLPQPEPALRGSAPVDSITFTSSTLQLMIQSSFDEEGLRIDGWITGGGVTVELHAGGIVRAEVSDAHGRLVWRGVPSGSLRFVLRPPDPDAKPVITPVIEL
ncbi:MAG TPA: hypothetical protein PKE40_04985 [Arachnia sp.]|nr:hypothetical protein [Arachnia sp.]HMT85688.1 hypothetical protein [Arachnia sp.]